MRFNMYCNKVSSLLCRGQSDFLIHLVFTRTGPTNKIEATFCGKFKSHLDCLCIKDSTLAVNKQLGKRMTDGQMVLAVANLISNVHNVVCTSS